MRSFVCTVAVLAPLAAYSLHGCSGGDPDASPVDASPETGRLPIDAPSGADVVREDGDEPPSGPTWAPEGWTSLQTLPGCGFIVPQSKETLPPPLRWEDCPADVLPASGASGTISRCRMLAPSWPSAATGQISYPAAELSQRPNHPPTLSIMRFQEGLGQLFTIADVDGSVHTAIAETTRHCFGRRPRARGDYFSISISDSNKPRSDGAVGGRIGDLTPRFLNKTPAREGTGAYPGAPGVAMVDTSFRISLVDWDTLEPTPIWNPRDDDALDAGELIFVGDDLLFSASSLTTQRIKVHVPGSGTRNLISDGPDRSRGPASPGTDGTDLVWIEGSERVDVGARVFPKVSIMTAPYSNDPDAIERTKRVLRSDLADPPFMGQTVVGCGYSASLATDKATNRLTHFVVRLRDGAAWKMPIELPGMPWRWTSPIGITCDEYFAITSVRTDFRIVRVPLSGLGTPIPPG